MADNRVIRTTVLDLASYLPPGTKFVIQKPEGTFKASWSTINSALTAYVANPSSLTQYPTTPPPSTPPPTTPPTSFGPLQIYFLNNGDEQLVMTTSSQAYVAVEYAGAAINALKFTVTYNGSVVSEWHNFTPGAPTTSLFNSATFDSTDIGWAGTGSYAFVVTARSVSSGNYDIGSNSITLIVSNVL